MRTPWLYKANELKHWNNDVKAQCNGKEIWIPARPYCLFGLNIVQRTMNAWGVFIGKYDAVDWQEDITQK